MQQIKFRAMNCQMLAVLDSDMPAANTALADVPAWFEQWEQCFSRFRNDSELSQLNLNVGQWVQVSEDLCAVIEAALWAAWFSDGLVSPALLGAMENAGYDRSFEQMNDVSRTQTARVSDGANDWHAIQVDSTVRRVFVPQTMRLDLSGIAKGWAAEQAARRLSPCGPALVDAGGDIAVSRTQVNGKAWPIGIADPLQVGNQLDVLLIEAGSVATSGRDYRRWHHAGAAQHHIMDPRTGHPAQTDVMSATLVAPMMLLAEAAAKTALILGSQAGMAWIESRPELAGVLVLEDGRVLRSHRMDKFTWK